MPLPLHPLERGLDGFQAFALSRLSEDGVLSYAKRQKSVEGDDID